MTSASVSSIYNLHQRICTRVEKIKEKKREPFFICMPTLHLKRNCSL